MFRKLFIKGYASDGQLLSSEVRRFHGRRDRAIVRLLRNRPHDTLTITSQSGIRVVWSLEEA